ncbi:hypothetical protein [Variovorax sp. PBL-H6]|uniref:hypothetical protein n=1 Tax=Variovorax sp. PBL-H6 TaxID=434009 RepID=UPI0013A536FE|nr:hypothetical protein [Variovorax sp. PBL-H6]
MGGAHLHLAHEPRTVGIDGAVPQPQFLADLLAALAIRRNYAISRSRGVKSMLTGRACEMSSNNSGGAGEGIAALHRATGDAAPEQRTIGLAHDAFVGRRPTRA